MDQQTYRIKLSDGREFDVTTEGGPPDEASIMASLGNGAPAPPVTPAAEPPPAPDSGGILSSIGDAVTGAAKGAAKTVLGIGDLAVNNPVVGPLVDAGYRAAGVPMTPEMRQDSMEWARSKFKPTNTAQSVGQGIEQTAEFFLPAAKLAKIKGALSTGSGLFNALTAMGLEGASAAAVDSAQKGSTEDALKTGALSAGAGLTMQGAAKAFQKGAQWFSEASVKALLKPSKSVLDGTTPTVMVRNLFKHDLGGTLEQSFEKATAKIAGKVNELRAVLNADPNATVKLGVLANDVLREMRGNPQAAKAMERIKDAVEFGLNKHGVDLKSGVLNLADANIAKQAVGELGAWTKGIRGNTLADADVYTEEIANRFYRKIKQAIEQRATAGNIAAINKELSELIPLRRAIIERIPVADRQNVINLGDMIGGATGNWGISAANRLFQSGRAANIVHKAGDAVNPAAVGAATARMTGAGQ